MLHELCNMILSTFRPELYWWRIMNIIIELLSLRWLLRYFLKVVMMTMRISDPRNAMSTQLSFWKLTLKLSLANKLYIFQMYSRYFIIRLNWSYHIRLPKNKTSSYYYYNCLSYQTLTRTQNHSQLLSFINMIFNFWI